MKWIYDGPVISFGKCICQKWHGETIAPTESKARSNLVYQFKKENKLVAGAKVTISGSLKQIKMEDDYRNE